MEKEQTAVEWLEKRFHFTKGQLIDYDFEQAKVIENKQREKDFVDGYKERALLSQLIFDEASKLFAKSLFNKLYK